jgi:heme a synthase
MSHPRYIQLAGLATLLALVVVVLGAYVRLSDAGLGCPDWPGCYGTLTVPRGELAVDAANNAYPDRPVEVGKAWREMAHRYVAGILGLMVFALAILAWRRRALPQQPLALPLGLSVLIVFQAALGMWTVTMLLKPAVVSAHLMGGMATLSLLWWLALRLSAIDQPRGPAHPLRGAALVGLGVVVGQIALGGWTSTNYAALACGVEFPTCHGQWLPWLEPSAAFQIWSPGEGDHEGGVLPNEARITIHAVHRLGALVTFLYMAGLSIALFRGESSGAVRRAAIGVGILLVAQVTIGIANVLMSLPLALAVAHNAGAALLLLGVVSVVHATGGGTHTTPLRH